MKNLLLKEFCKDTAIFSSKVSEQLTYKLVELDKYVTYLENRDDVFSALNEHIKHLEYMDDEQALDYITNNLRLEDVFSENELRLVLAKVFCKVNIEA